MLLKIEIDVEDLMAFVRERDSLRLRIQQLEAEPNAFSRQWLADKVREHIKNRSYTPDQIKEIHDLISGVK